MVDTDLVQLLHDTVGPVTLACDQLVDVPDALLPLFPLGGLPPGSVVQVAGHGAWSIALAVAAAAAGTEGWIAELGVEGLGLSTATELGVDLNRFLMIDTTPQPLLPKVISSLIEAMTVIILPPLPPTSGSPHGGMLPRPAARRLKAQAREKGVTLIALTSVPLALAPRSSATAAPSAATRAPNRTATPVPNQAATKGSIWPELPDITISSIRARWEGIEWGHGRLMQRHLDLHAHGRRASAKPRTTTVLLPAPDGRLQPAEPTPTEPTPATSDTSRQHQQWPITQPAVVSQQPTAAV